MPKRILIIDNHPANQKLMSYLLKGRGYDVLTADSGEVGLDIAMHENLDLILCDIRMPGMDGFEVAHRLHNDTSRPKVPLVAVSALALAGDRERLMAAGFDGYLTKGVAPMHFVQQVQQFLPDASSDAAPEQSAE